METRGGVRGIGSVISNLVEKRDIILHGADLLSAKGFTQVPNHVLESDKISASAKLTYAMLLKYAWQNDCCFPGQDRLAKEMGVARTSTNAYLQELQEQGFIEITRRGQGRPNIYKLILVEKGRWQRR